ncbi:Co2+/Mg2+ efflux protein ApaG [Deinococcus fonticola]|uniref:Co2+/Mg2+ efflux protein ApaG n=1 Tax=Deinococcus fonticola TaxID=2528713 RepID=UPI0023EA78BE|nr:Co2+/Mg2+ efflux protein ApaG [Deinococcus fonticola]
MKVLTDIHVGVTVGFMPEHSRAGQQVFQYQITIENRSGDTWQLLARHWDIQDGNGRLFSVDGEGVIGEQPLLRPGAKYTYDSFVTIEIQPGHMRGYYVMQDAWGERAQVPIPPFHLSLGERVLN